MIHKLRLAAALALFGVPVVAAEPHPLFEDGLGAYKLFCAKCHGADMVNPGTSSFDLRKFPQDDRARFEDSIMNGRGDMPAWGDIILPEELEALWVYVATRAGTEPFPEQAEDGDETAVD